MIRALVLAILLLAVEGKRGSTLAAAAAASHRLSRVEQIAQELRINNNDPNEDIRTNVILNMEGL